MFLSLMMVLGSIGNAGTPIEACPNTGLLGSRISTTGLEGPADMGDGEVAFKLADKFVEDGAMCTLMLSKNGLLGQINHYRRSETACEAKYLELKSKLGAHAPDPAEAIWRISTNKVVKFERKAGIFKCVVQGIRFDLMVGVSNYKHWPIVEQR